MSVGNVVDKNQVDFLSGQISRTVDAWAPDALKFKAWLDTMTEDDLTKPPFNYEPMDVAVLKSAFNDLSLLANIYLGKDVITEARDLGTFSRRLAGLYV